MRYTLPPLNSLRAFEAAARRQSIVAAARELCVTQGAVSRHVNNLENFLGEKLFRRTKRGIELTPKGAALQEATRNAFDMIAGAVAQASASQQASPIRLNLTPTFAVRWLVPRLARFYQRCPDVAIEMSTSYHPDMTDSDEFDVAVTYGSGNYAHLRAEQLFLNYVMPVCAPRLANGDAPPATFEALSEHLLIHSINRPFMWPNWLAGGGINNVNAEAGLRMQNSSLVYQAALDGLGVAIGELAFLADDIDSGRLVAPLGPARRDAGGAYYFVYPTLNSSKPGVAEFRAWILEEAAMTSDYVSKRWLGAGAIHDSIGEDSVARVMAAARAGAARRGVTQQG